MLAVTMRGGLGVDCIRRESRGTVKGRRRSVRAAVLFLAAAIAVFIGAFDHPRSASAGALHAKSWFDSKSAFIFDLGGARLPSSRDDLADGLTRAWTSHLRFPQGAGQIVSATGERYPALQTLHVSLANGVIRNSADDKADLKPSGRIDSRLLVSDFDLDARPLISDKAKLSIHMAATDARFDVERDKKGRAMMLMSDAQTASFEFQISNEDLERMIVRDCNEAGADYHVKIDKVTMKFSTANNRSIDVDLRLWTHVAYIPAGMHFQAHVDIDDAMNARVSNLKIDGDEALGPLITGILRPGLKKFEGLSKPIFRFPNSQLQLRDVKLQGGDDVKIAAVFGR